MVQPQKNTNEARELYNAALQAAIRLGLRYPMGLQVLRDEIDRVEATINGADDSVEHIAPILPFPIR